jgi:hypothetical protein
MELPKLVEDLIKYYIKDLRKIERWKKKIERIKKAELMEYWETIDQYEELSMKRKEGLKYAMSFTQYKELNNRLLDNY